MKSPITKIKEDIIFDGMTYRFCILLLFDLVFDSQNNEKMFHI